jgi:hypothetical protein
VRYELSSENRPDQSLRRDEGDDDYPDSKECEMRCGRVIFYALVLGDFRRASDFLTKMDNLDA